MKRFWLAAAVAFCLTAPATAQTFPSKPIVIVVPFAAGGPTDTIARLIGQGIAQRLSAQVIVENTAGAGGTTAIRRVAKAEPDGHTLLVSHVNHASTASLYKKLDYDAVADFAPIGLITDGAMAFVANVASPANSMADVVRLAKERGEKLTYAHAGVGSGSHLCGLLFQSALKVKLTEIPYRGTGPALNDIVANQVDLLCDQVTNVAGQIDGGRIKVLGVTSRERLAPKLKDVPTVGESALPGFEVTVWHGLYAPKGTPGPVVVRLNEALNAAIADATFQQRMADLSTTPASPRQATPDALRAKLEAEVKSWRDIFAAAGVSAE